MKTSRIVYVSRDPLIHQIGGSTTYTRSLLGALRESGAQVTVVATNAYSCSPLLWFRAIAEVPQGVRLIVPGFLRIGKLYLNLFSPAAWARAISRVGARFKALQPVARLVERLFAASLNTDAWDLTEATRREQEVALNVITQADATTVMVNYDFWAPLMQRLQGSGRKRVIHMHDLLSARTQSFLESGTPLDSRPIAEAEEMRWLATGDCVLAAQAREAEYIRTQIPAPVLVQPIIYRAVQLQREPDAGRCLFVGANIAPNQTGIRWFLDDVWPLVRAAVPSATLAVVGSICSFLSDGIPGVEKRNVVPSLDEEYARASVCIVPLRIGSGIKIKLVEALSFGKAVVSTNVGVQGVEDWAPTVVDVSDDPMGFANALVQLFQDTHARKAREERAREAFTEHLGSGAALSAEFIEHVL